MDENRVENIYARFGTFMKKCTIDLKIWTYEPYYNSHGRKKKENVRFHRFPKDSELQKKWIHPRYLGYTFVIGKDLSIHLQVVFAAYILNLVTINEICNMNY